MAKKKGTHRSSASSTTKKRTALQTNDGRVDTSSSQKSVLQSSKRSKSTHDSATVAKGISNVDKLAVEENQAQVTIRQMVKDKVFQYKVFLNTRDTIFKKKKGNFAYKMSRWLNVHDADAAAWHERNKKVIKTTFNELRNQVTTKCKAAVYGKYMS